MTRKRILRPEEKELWDLVAQSATRLHPTRLQPEAILTPHPPAPTVVSEPKSIPRFSIGQAARSRSGTAPSLAPISDRLAQAPVRMDTKAFGRLKRGKLVPEARIDLHGLTLDQAHPDLMRFILTSHARGLRLVLVITGKGQRHDPYDPMPLRRGVLKQQVPQWLRLPPMSLAVLQVAEAHVKHGGGGAYYVYLTRRK
ncbi:MAG: Smr/MutS family protein [Paracoccaceae bacterium]